MKCLNFHISKNGVQEENKMIKKLKEALSNINSIKIATFLFYLGNIIVIVGLYICMAICYGIIGSAVSLGLGLMLAGLFSLFRGGF